MNAARERVAEGREGSGERAQKIQERCAAAKLPSYCDGILLCLLSHEAQFRDPATGRLELLAWPSQDLIAHRTRLSRPTVRKGLRLLEQAGILRARPAPGGVNGHHEYVLVCTKGDQPPRFEHVSRRTGGAESALVGRQDASALTPSAGNAVTLRGKRRSGSVGNAVAPNDPRERLKKESTPLPPCAMPAAPGGARAQQRMAKEGTGPEPFQLTFPTLAENDDAVTTPVRTPAREAIQAPRQHPLALTADPVGRPRSGHQTGAQASQTPSFTVAQMLETFAAGAGSCAVVSPFNPKLAPALTRVIRDELAPTGLTLEDVRLAGEYRRIALAWRSEPTGLPALARPGALFDLISQARAWKAAGRPAASRGGQHAPVHLTQMMGTTSAHGRAKRAPTRAAAYAGREDHSAFDSAVYRTGEAERIGRLAETYSEENRLGALDALRQADLPWRKAPPSTPQASDTAPRQ